MDQENARVAIPENTRCDRSRRYGEQVATGWWNLDGWPSADEWQAWWAFLTLLVAALAAGLALRQLGAYIAEQEERARPFLMVDFDFRSTMLYITVENISDTPATNVTLIANPKLQTTSGRDKVLEGILDGKFLIPQVAPGRNMRWYVDQTADLYARTDLPHRFELEVNYDDPRQRSSGWPFRRKGAGHYIEVFVLDLDQYGEASADQDYDNRNWNIAKRNEKRVENLAKSATSIAASLKTISDSRSGLDESELL